MDEAPPCSANSAHFEAISIQARTSARCLELHVAAAGFGSNAFWFFGIDMGSEPAILWTCAAIFKGTLAEIGEIRAPITQASLDNAKRWARGAFGPSMASNSSSRLYWEKPLPFEGFSDAALDDLATNWPEHAWTIIHGTGFDPCSIARIEAALLRRQVETDREGNASKRL